MASMDRRMGPIYKQEHNSYALWLAWTYVWDPSTNKNTIVIRIMASMDRRMGPIYKQEHNSYALWLVWIDVWDPSTNKNTIVMSYG